MGAFHVLVHSAHTAHLILPIITTLTMVRWKEHLLI